MYVSVGGTIYQAENQSTNTGVWAQNQCGGSNSERLHCNGHISFSTPGNARIASPEVANSSDQASLLAYPNTVIIK